MMHTSRVSSYSGANGYSSRGPAMDSRSGEPMPLMGQRWNDNSYSRRNGDAPMSRGQADMGRRDEMSNKRPYPQDNSAEKRYMRDAPRDTYRGGQDSRKPPPSRSGPDFMYAGTSQSQMNSSRQPAIDRYGSSSSGGGSSFGGMPPAGPPSSTRSPDRGQPRSYDKAGGRGGGSMSGGRQFMDDRQTSSSSSVGRPLMNDRQQDSTNRTFNASKMQMSGVNSSWLEPSSWSKEQERKAAEEKRMELQRLQRMEEERAREHKEKMRRFEELTRRERELVEKERQLKEQMRRKEEERRIAEQVRMEERRLEELRRKEDDLRQREERRLIAIKIREAELVEKEQRLLRIEEERRIEEHRLIEEERYRSMHREMERRRESDHSYRRDSRGLLPRPRVSSSTSVASGRVEKRTSASRSSSSVHQRIKRPEKPKHRESAFQRLGAKVPIKARLGSDAKIRPGRTAMSITVTADDRKRKVANKPVLETIDQVGEIDTGKSEEEEKKEMEESKERERQLKERLLREQEAKNKQDGEEKLEEKMDEKMDESTGEPDLDKVVIKKRDKRASSGKEEQGKSLTVHTPQNLVGKLAMKLKELPKPAVEPKMKTDKEKLALKKKIKEKFCKSDLPEKILYLALENVAYDEKRASILLNKMIQEETDDQPAQAAEEIVTLDDDECLDYEAEEPEN